MFDENILNIRKLYVLLETFPGIQSDKEGACQYCHASKPAHETHRVKSKYSMIFQDLFQAQIFTIFCLGMRGLEGGVEMTSSFLRCAPK